MALEQFQEPRFRQSSLVKVRQANSIIEDYVNDGLTLTLRQLYYQFVSRGWVPNNQRQYDNLGKLINNARLCGLIDWDAIEDRTRFIRGVQTWNNPAHAIRGRASMYAIDMWENQDVKLEVWIEKDALVGVIERVCMRNDVDYFACRGYVSQSEQYKAGKRLKQYAHEGQTPVVIHLGDHDPSGIDMTRDNDDRLNMFSGYCGVEVKRIALNMSQIEQYSPPPNPAKMSDSRAGAYVEQYGNSSWELDALEPRVLERLIQSTIDEYKDPDAWQEREDVLAKDKEALSASVDFAYDYKHGYPTAKEAIERHAELQEHSEYDATEYLDTWRNGNDLSQWDV